MIAYDKSLLRIDDGTNLLFADGHVEFIENDQLKGFLGDFGPAGSVRIRTNGYLLSVPADLPQLKGIVPANGQSPDKSLFTAAEFTQLLKTLRKEPQVQVLTTPAVMSLDNESAELRINGGADGATAELTLTHHVFPDGTGTRMASRRSEIVIQFKPVPHSIFGATETLANKLVIRLQPDEGVRLFLQIKEPGPGGLRIKSLPLNLTYAENFHVRYPDAYERLLMDVVRGNLALFMRRDEVEAAWSWTDRLIAAWADAEMAPEAYAAGTDGPVSAAVMMERDGRKWGST